MLAEANALNEAITEYFNNNPNSINREILENYKTNILGILVDITPGQNFNEETKNNLNINLDLINNKLSSGTGKYKKGKKTKKRRGKKQGKGKSKKKGRGKKQRKGKKIQYW